MAHLTPWIACRYTSLTYVEWVWETLFVSSVPEASNLKTCQVGHRLDSLRRHRVHDVRHCGVVRAGMVAAVDQVVVRGWVVADGRMTTSVKVIDL